MNSHWMIDTHGDPLGALRAFLTRLWGKLALDGMLAPLNEGVDQTTGPRLLVEPVELSKVNPFNPLMPLNAARLVPKLLTTHPDARYGVVLRPCELRALIEMSKHDGFDLTQVVTLAVDCLGTFPVEDFTWRARRQEAPGTLTREALQFARQGGILEYRYRPACQFCLTPAAEGADINLGVLGLPVRQVLLVSAKDPETAEYFHLPELVDGRAPPRLLEQRRRLLAKLEARHARTRERLLAGLEGLLPQDIDELLLQFKNCGGCQRCLDVCPICSVGFPHRDAAGDFERADLMRWLVSCVGCGMCEQACPQDRPLGAIFTYLRDQLGRPWDYVPGESMDASLPQL